MDGMKERQKNKGGRGEGRHTSHGEMWKYEKMKIKQELKHDLLHYKFKQWLFCVTGGVRQGRSLPLQCVTRLVPAAKQHTCNSELNNAGFLSQSCSECCRREPVNLPTFTASSLGLPLLC